MTNTNYVDSPIVNGTTHYYVISAVKGIETKDSAVFAPLFVAVAPTLTSAKAISKSQIDVKWTDNSNNVAVFKIERSTNNNFWSEIATVAAGQTSFSNLGLARNTTYSYRVRAINAAGNSSYSNIATARTLK